MFNGWPGVLQNKIDTMITLQHSGFCAIPHSQIPSVFTQPLRKRNPLFHQQQHFPKSKASTFRISSLGAGPFHDIAQIAHNKVPHFQIYGLYVPTNSGFLSSFDFVCYILNNPTSCFDVSYAEMAFFSPLFCDPVLLRFWLQLVLLCWLGSFLSLLLLCSCMAKSLISRLLFRLGGSHHHTLLYGFCKTLNQLIQFSPMPHKLLILVGLGFSFTVNLTKLFAFSCG